MYNIKEELETHRSRIQEELSKIISDEVLEDGEWISTLLNSIDEEGMNDKMDILVSQLNTDPDKSIDTIGKTYNKIFKRQSKGEVFTPNKTSDAILSMLFSDDFRKKYLNHDEYITECLDNIYNNPRLLILQDPQAFKTINKIQI